MGLGLPQIIIEFVKKAKTLITRSGRGVVVLILDDTTKTDSKLVPYAGIDEVSDKDWTEKNYDLIRMAFKAETNKVLCVRAVHDDESTVNLAASLELVRYINFDYLTSPLFKKTDGDVIKAFIKKVRKEGKKAKAVVPDYEADYEAIINFAMPSVSVVWDTDVVTYTTAEYCCRIAGILAAVPLTQSSTYYVLDEIVDTELFDDPETEIDAGKLIIIFDGEKYKIARGITSLVEITEDHPKDFQKIKCMEGADLIKYDIRSTYEESFVGKKVASYDNKQEFIGAVNQYLIDLENTVVNKEEEHYVELNAEAILAYLKADGTDTDDMTEQEIVESDTGSTLFLAGKLKLLDALEDLNLRIAL